MAKPSTVASITGPMADSDRLPLSVNGGPWTDATLSGLALRKGGAANTTPNVWTEYHRFSTQVQGGSWAAGSAATILLWGSAGVVGGSDNGSLAVAGTKRTTGDYSGTNQKSTGNQFVNVVESLTGVPSDNISPLEACDFVIDYNPGSALTWTDARGQDIDLQTSTGTITNLAGSTARCRFLTGSTITTFTGYQSVGPNLGGANTAGTLTNYVGFHAGFDPRITSPISGSVVNSTGVLIDKADGTNINPSGTELAIDITDVNFPIRLGSTNKQEIGANGATGQLNIDTTFVQSGAFDAGGGLAFTADITTVTSAFYSTPSLLFTTTYNDSNSPNSSVVSSKFQSNISGASNACLARIGLSVVVQNQSKPTQHVKALEIINSDTSTTNKYKYGLFVTSQTATASIDDAAIAIGGTGLQNGIAFDAKDGASSASAGAYIHWDGTDLLCTVGGTSYIINSGTTKP